MHTYFNLAILTIQPYSLVTQVLVYVQNKTFKYTSIF